MKEATDLFVDIIKEKNRSRIIVLSVVGLCLAIILSSLIFAYVVYRESSNTAYAIGESGNVSTLEKVELITKTPDELKFQLTYLFSAYYTIDFTNTESRESALRLFVNDDYIKLEKKWEPWFKNVREQSLSQEAVFVEESLKISQLNQSGHFQVFAQAILSVDNAGYQNIYVLSVNTKVKRVGRSFPLNPHGFIFYDYQDEIVLRDKNVPIQ
ncbi:MAG: hypothetical protein RIB01_15240 [Balneola sp.]